MIEDGRSSHASKKMVRPFTFKRKVVAPKRCQSIEVASYLNDVLRTPEYEPNHSSVASRLELSVITEVTFDVSCVDQANGQPLFS